LAIKLSFVTGGRAAAGYTETVVANGSPRDR
jgi:hypothetical protein